jgi:hypothetical protein
MIHRVTAVFLGVHQSTFCFLSCLPEDGNRTNFRTAVVLKKFGKWAKSKTTVLSNVSPHRQLSSNLNYELISLFCYRNNVNTQQPTVGNEKIKMWHT